MSDSPPVSPFLKNSIVHIPHTNAKTFPDDVLLNTYDGAGTSRITKKKKNDNDVTKEPNKEWKLNEKAAIVVPQTLKYRGGQLNAAPVLEVKNFTNWKKRFICHIIGIEPQFENIIKNGPFTPMTVGQRKPENKWTRDERKAANLD
nr:hypothetical protein [Tanacetum cinerariifolium]